MKIKLLQGLATQRATYGPGQVIEWDDKEALRMVDAGYAERVEPERATNENRSGGRK